MEFFGNFIELSAKAACCHAVIDPDNCVIEMERVIGEARKQNQPAYIIIPSDYALFPVTPYEARPLTLKSSAAALKKAVTAIDDRLKAAKSVVAFAAFTISRLGLQKEAQKAIEALGCPFAVTYAGLGGVRTAVRQNHYGRALSPLRRLHSRGRYSRSRNWQFQPRARSDEACRRRTELPPVVLSDVAPSGDLRPEEDRSRERAWRGISTLAESLRTGG